MTPHIHRARHRRHRGGGAQPAVVGDEGFTLTCPLPSYIVRLFGWARKSTIGSLSGSTYTALGSQTGEWCAVALSSLFLVSSGGDWLAHGRAQTRGGEERKQEEEEGGQERGLGRGREPLRESDIACSGASLRCSRLRVGSFMQRLSGCLRNMGDELFSTPIDVSAYPACDPLHPSSPPTAPASLAPFPKYYLAPFLDLDRCDASSLDPSLRALFCKRALSARHPQAGPAAAPEIIPFL
ncbi:hypothetical protein B0H14DRAFT_3696100 [Mycena olivaceomarginata]|nr:hypothetical protein B0H14DRAFT_3696100 [Mycena olivaceomarginata]